MNGMPLRRHSTALALGAGLALLSAGAQAIAAPKHVFVILMENHATDQIIGNAVDAPFINNDLLKRPGVSYATQYFGVTHPSLPNYLALVSGSSQGIHDDCKAGADVTCKPEEFVPDSDDPSTAGHLLTDEQAAQAARQPHLFSGDTIVDQLEKAGHSWKAYMEAMPATDKLVEYAPTGDDGKPIKLYAQKHNPFVYFDRVRSNPERMAKLVPYEQLAEDLAGNAVPDFVWITPHQCHDMHGVSPANATAVKMPDCGYPDSGIDHGAIKLGDAYLADVIQKITGSAAWKEGASLVIVWDEDDYAGFAGTAGSPIGINQTVLGGARAPLIVLSSDQAPPKKLDAPANHYNLLAAIEDAWQLGCLENSCAAAKGNTLAGLIK
jgi:phosphatidylinositol-3-phosphatase